MSRVETSQQAIGERTIREFGRQWSQHTSVEGYYGSAQLLRDHFEGLLDIDVFDGATVLDVGSGAGRVVRMLLEAGARRVVAVEPSDAFATLRANVAPYGTRVDCRQLRGDQIELDGEVDIAVSLGVLHHIPRPDAVVAAMFQALRDGGTIAIWLYAREGNRLYLLGASPLRRIARWLPDAAVWALARALAPLLSAYAAACRRVRLPMRRYMVEVIGKLDRSQRVVTIVDQLRPTYARYYTQRAAQRLLTNAGFDSVRAMHRHGYSWSVIGSKPVGTTAGTSREAAVSPAASAPLAPASRTTR